MPNASHNSNFAFLADHDERLAKIGYEAEQLASISRTACMLQVHLLAESLVEETAAHVGEGASFYQVLSCLEWDSVEFGKGCATPHEVGLAGNVAPIHRAESSYEKGTGSISESTLAACTVVGPAEHMAPNAMLLVFPRLTVESYEARPE